MDGRGRRAAGRRVGPTVGERRTAGPGRGETRRHSPDVRGSAGPGGRALRRVAVRRVTPAATRPSGPAAGAVGLTGRPTRRRCPPQPASGSADGAVAAVSVGDYLILTVAPASSSSFLSFSASSLEMPVLTVFGAPSTRSLASFRPRPVAVRTTLMTLILLAPKASRTTSNSVCAATGAAAPAAAAAAAGPAATAAALMPWTLQVVAQGLGLQHGQLDDRVAQGLDVVGEGGQFGGGHRSSDPFRGFRAWVARARVASRGAIAGRRRPGDPDSSRSRMIRVRLGAAIRPLRRRGGLGSASAAASPSAGPFGEGLQLGEQAAGRGVGQRDDPLGRGQGQAHHAADQGLAAGQLGDVLDLGGADHDAVDGPPLDLGLLELLDLGGDLLGQLGDAVAAPDRHARALRGTAPGRPCPSR